MRAVRKRDGSNTTAVSYTRGNGLGGSREGAGGMGGLLARSSSYSGGNFTTHNYYFTDGNGNVTYMLNSSQSMVASYRYVPFGKTTSSSGTLASANVYRFSSKGIHANSGMYYYGYRFYDPNLQRWINRDPMGDSTFEINRDHLDKSFMPVRPAEMFEGANFYAYVHNRPVEFVDPFGDKMAPACVACAICLSALAVDCSILCRDGTWDQKGEGYLACMAKCATALPLYSITCGGICGICGVSGPKCPAPPKRPPIPPSPRDRPWPRQKYPPST